MSTSIELSITLSISTRSAGFYGISALSVLLYYW